MRRLRISLYTTRPHTMRDSSAAALVAELLCCHAGSSAGLWLPPQLGLELDLSVSTALVASATTIPHDAQTARAVAMRTLLTRRHS